MSLFRRNKNSYPNSAESDPVSADTAKAIGGVGLQKPLREGHEQPKSYADELRERTLALQATQLAFIEGLIDEGAPVETDFSGAVAQAMSDGTFPRVVRGMTFRGSGQQLLLLDGVIPPEALEVSAKAGSPRMRDRFVVSVGLSKDWREMGDGFTVTSTGMLPQFGGEPDYDTLGIIDSHLAVVEQQQP